MSGEILYSDSTVILTDKEVKILNYYFWGLHKTIPIQQIKQIKLFKLTAWLKYRLMGASYKYWWHYFPMDFKRKNKEMFIAIYLNCLWKPCVTPQRPTQFFQAFSQLVPKFTDMIKINQEFGTNEEQMEKFQKQE